MNCVLKYDSPILIKFHDFVDHIDDIQFWWIQSASILDILKHLLHKIRYINLLSGCLMQYLQKVYGNDMVKMDISLHRDNIFTKKDSKSKIVV